MRTVRVGAKICFASSAAALSVGSVDSFRRMSNSNQAWKQSLQQPFALYYEFLLHQTYHERGYRGAPYPLFLGVYQAAHRGGPALGYQLWTKTQMVHLFHVFSSSHVVYFLSFRSFLFIVACVFTPGTRKQAPGLVGSFGGLVLLQRGCGIKASVYRRQRFGHVFLQQPYYYYYHSSQ